jgi:hypothetical protein
VRTADGVAATGSDSRLNGEVEKGGIMGRQLMDRLKGDFERSKDQRIKEKWMIFY